MTMGTNLLGPFALTNLLFGRVRSQIINVGSDAHKMATLRLDDMHLRSHRWAAYRGVWAFKTCGDALGPRTRPPLARSAVARHYPAHTPGMGGLQSVQRIRHAIDGGFSSSGRDVGKQIWQRHRRRRCSDAVLHQRTDPAGQLCGRRGPARAKGRSGSDRPIGCCMRLRGSCQSVRVRRKRNRDNAFLVAPGYAGVAKIATASPPTETPAEPIRSTSLVRSSEALSAASIS